MGLDEGEVSEAHGPVLDRRGPGTWFAHKAAGLPRKRQQTGTLPAPVLSRPSVAVLSE